MQKISEPRTNRRPMPEPIPCRWKHLRGQGTDAIYRASCGTGCPGHLGDLRFVDGHYLQRRISMLQPIDPDAPAWERKLSDEEYAAMAAAYLPRRVGIARGFASAWILSASPLIGRPQDAIYHGYADSGFKITVGGKRASNRARVGRRGSPIYDRMMESRKPQGQTVQPPARIWCPACGMLSVVELPESLRSDLVQIGPRQSR